MPRDLYFLRQLLTGASPNYLSLAMLAGLLVTAIFRPKRIRRLSMFRTACVLLAVSVALGPALNALMSLSDSSRGMMSSPGSMGEYSSLLSFGEALGSILLAFSICMGIFSLLPAGNEVRLPIAPKHPMDS